ncbi:MAG: hypothetical protein AB8G18_08315 [Gammaproteobacteria bacterium]
MHRNLYVFVALLAVTLIPALDATANGDTATATKLSETSIGLVLDPIDYSCGSSVALVELYRADIGSSSFTEVFSDTFDQADSIPPFTPLPPGRYRFNAQWCVDVIEFQNGEEADVFVDEDSNIVTLFGAIPPASLRCLTGTCSGEEGGSYYELDGNYTLTWPSVSGATKYEVQVAESPSLSSFSDLAINIVDTFLPINNTQNGTYRYRVRSCYTSTVCSDDWTEIDMDIVLNLVPSPPRNVNASNNFDNVFISWGAPVSGNVAEYELTEIPPDGPSRVTKHSNSPVTRDAQGLGEYEYQVKACSRLNDAFSCSVASSDTTTIGLSSCTEQSSSYEVQSCPSVSHGSATGELGYLLSQADRAFDIGAAFLCDDNENIFRSGLLDQSDPEWRESLIGLVDGLPTYDAAALAEAEGFYNCALDLDPGNEAAIEGVLNVRHALAFKANLVSDTLQRNQFLNRFESAAPGSASQTLLVSQEISLIQDAISELDGTISSILGLYASSDVNGPGAVLRGDIELSNNDLVKKTLRTLFGSLSRIADYESALSHAKIDQGFYLEVGTDSRDSILDALENSQARLTLAMQIIIPFINESTFDLPEPGESDSTVDELTNQAAILGVNRAIGELGELSELLRQGYNPFGFVPDFVPFVRANGQDDNLDTFNEMRLVADGAIGDLRVNEATICGACDGNVGGLLAQLRQFASSEGQYEDRLNALETTYEQRLRTLVGDVVFEGRIQADIYTFLYPDVDLDGDGISERDERRIQLSTSGYNFSSGNKGQIGEQYGIIGTAELRAEDTLDQMSDLVERMELLEAEAQELADLDLDTADYIFERLTADGERVSLLIKQRGYVQQAAADKAAKDAKRRSLLSSTIGLVGAVASGNVVALVSAGTAFRNAALSSSRSGSSAGQVGVIDAQINDIRTLQQADIVVSNAASSAEGRLIKAGYAMYNLALSQNNLALSYAVAQRDIDREINALGRQVAEVTSLISDLERSRALLERNDQNVVVGWDNEDVRDTLSDSIVKSEQALKRAKVWSYVTLRALDYYANLPPNESTGQPDGVLLDLYQRIYLARRSEELAYVSTTMDTLARTQFLFSQGTTSCGSQSQISMKNDIFASHPVFYDPVTGDETGTADIGVFEYYSSHEGRTFTGAVARAVLFRDELRRNLRGDLDDDGDLINRTLEIRFNTNLFPPQLDSPEFRATNPFYLKSAKTAKITGFENPNCGGDGSSPGIQIDFLTDTVFVDPVTGAQANAPAVRIFQEGNSYLKHTGWDADDFTDSSQSQLEEPMENLTVFTAYEQLLPTWLIGDINTGSSLVERTIGSAVSDTIIGLISGSEVGEGPNRSLAFTDRSVANDAWRIVIEESDSTNDQFFAALQNMLDAPIEEIPQFLNDIQLDIGWASRNGGTLQTTPETE